MAIIRRLRGILRSLLSTFKPTKQKKRWARIVISALLLYKRGSPTLWVDNQEDLSAVIPISSQTYLVCLGDGIIESYGILLQQISPNTEGGTKMMVKIGMWYSSNTTRSKGTKKVAYYSLRSEDDVCPTTEVDWRVM